ncbi:LysR family transcriptional regulator [Kibdelosporangium phytohabitans]|uniref:LysR family transcriptional regulator n=1 Tax=Kibdelosporangium phytohabitans TaxID=860235 RepID=A0A0N9I9C1_9PSEU|nr:LysR family transcriptional regulator [Kibdelosporangium phytohabitans]ALG11238.1 LysR family transcriptional regulator [Kibdelosporangium phytohabitans]MBE1462518.1 DNA-binding transcriptional LysR family regulator [Kibdelosporangium phytohabitans]
MDARQLEYFLAVVDHGGVNRAASALFLTQPSLSQAIRALERDLGQELFHRVGRRLVLTDSGRALVEPARDVIRGLAVARDSVSGVGGLVTGRVEIAAMPSQAVEPLSGMIKLFTERHPGMRVSIKSAFTAPDVLEMVRTGVTELGLLGSSEPPSAVGITLKMLRRQRFVVVAPAGRFPGRTALKGEDLDGHAVIAGQPGTGMRRVVDRIRADGVGLRLVVESEHREAILPLVLGGVGLAVLTESWATLARQAGADVLDLDPPAYLNIALASRDAWLSPAADAFVRLIAAAYKPGR